MTPRISVNETLERPCQAFAEESFGRMMVLKRLTRFKAAWFKLVILQSDKSPVKQERMWKMLVNSCMRTITQTIHHICHTIESSYQICQIFTENLRMPSVIGKFIPQLGFAVHVPKRTICKCILSILIY